MQARDHLLTGIATLLVTQALNEIEVQHLGQEGLTGGVRDPGDAGLDVQQLPAGVFAFFTNTLNFLFSSFYSVEF